MALKSRRLTGRLGPRQGTNGSRRDLDSPDGRVFLKLRLMTCIEFPFGSEFAGPLLAGRSPERTIRVGFETDLRRWFGQPGAGSFAALREEQD